MKYLDIYHLLKEQILKGEYPAGTPVEGEHALAERYGVSRPTIQKAVARLKRESFVHTRQGSGIFVNPPEFYQDNNVITLSERIHRDQTLDSVVLSYDIQPADDALASLFAQDAGALLIHYRRMRIINQQPAIIEETWMPQSLFPDFCQDTCRQSVLQYIEQTCGFAISHDVKTWSGTMLNADEAWLLRLSEGEVRLRISHKVYLQSGQLAQYTLETLATNSVTTVSMR
ncbi:GntR family transcriptional regulator [[Enterobacter] lignolyticus]|uniref:Transcriptional regulator, GntR family n=1 Tax=Enterobacter lignolyticus (strain SCF1) TaxID=701347 RepID=E3G1J4_ENTLS|nr:GntR family transcriptional regulator [[Enterobacter] lignolyticus]ADO50279.1 transcriptional regulator, GntR family [[Enterobacter] lignolyticus SCF1]